MEKPKLTWWFTLKGPGLIDSISLRFVEARAKSARQWLTEAWLLGLFWIWSLRPSTTCAPSKCCLGFWEWPPWCPCCFHLLSIRSREATSAPEVIILLIPRPWRAQSLHCGHLRWSTSAASALYQLCLSSLGDRKWERLKSGSTLLRSYGGHMKYGLPRVPMDLPTRRSLSSSPLSLRQHSCIAHAQRITPMWR